MTLGRWSEAMRFHREGEVLGERYEGEQVLVRARLDERAARRYAEFVQP